MPLSRWLFVLGVGCGAPPVTTPLPLQTARAVRADLDCLDRWDRPAELMGEDGFGHHGWTEAELQRFTASWGVPNDFNAAWISNASRPGEPSARVHVLRAPDLAACTRDGVRQAMDGANPAADLLALQAAFAERDVPLDGLRTVASTDLKLEESTENPLFRALMAASLAPNSSPNAPTPAPADEAALQTATSAWPEPAQRALADLVLATVAAQEHRDAAFSDADADAVQRVHQTLRDTDWATLQIAFAHPTAGPLEADLKAVAESTDLIALSVGAHRLATAADGVVQALADVSPFEGGDLWLQTAHGVIRFRSTATDDLDADLSDVALLVDLGGDDQRSGTVAATTQRWQAASVVIDMSGDDTYGADTPDIQEAGTQASAAFDARLGWTQGAGLMGYGLLIDASGNDEYAASVMAQGAGMLGVGVLSDRAGDDTYRLGTHGQGMGMFGLGLLHDALGDDDLRLLTLGQGAGKSGGVGWLVDGDGNDTTIAYVQQQDPWLPAEYAAPNLLNYPSSWAYGIDGVPHYMSIAQGTGWGYRADWLAGGRNWGGGYGALVDLGEGTDLRVADCMSMGQGFIYGMGMLYDDGGDDTYRNFWWGMGASAHMGVGLLWDRGGNDDRTTTRASSAFGYDYGVGWFIDDAGDDVYRGQVHFGRGYQNAWTFFVDRDGDDTYNADRMRGGNVYFGVVRNNDGGRPNVRLGGAFLDLGGTDTYNTDIEGPTDGATWYHAPIGDEAVVSETNHRGVGIDR